MNTSSTRVKVLTRKNGGGVAGTRQGYQKAIIPSQATGSGPGPLGPGVFGASMSSMNSPTSNSSYLHLDWGLEYCYLDETLTSSAPTQQLGSPPLHSEATGTWKMAPCTDVAEATSELASSPSNVDALIDDQFDRVERRVLEKRKPRREHTRQGSGFGFVPPSKAFKVIEASERINEKFVADAVARSQISARKVNKRRPPPIHKAA
ncbi:hypothetical protein B0T26DRAFT_716947 [Lasiosphaeria miniovina]|uniref:Uncharacterized protein n=1 Tax=Lasiosphaeria miniovina TaxID=1954250 RepID=A0AA40ACK2_9PEZI|nr:uncharacterized protein B0T26DRAFT_716947 [Lasiosphaeria miniovina]KAK0713275.1 hypothetical protein B0T26DRAFT_716947 [Lasiosphaeria miniovina]